MSAPLAKAVILAAGRGSRMREPRSDVLLERAQAEMADRGLKGMIPIAGRPFLDYVLSALADAGYEHACLVIGADHDLVRTYYTGAHLTSGSSYLDHRRLQWRTSWIPVRPWP